MKILLFVKYLRCSGQWEKKSPLNSALAHFLWRLAVEKREHLELSCVHISICALLFWGIISLLAEITLLVDLKAVEGKQKLQGADRLLTFSVISDGHPPQHDD